MIDTPDDTETETEKLLTLDVTPQHEEEPPQVTEIVTASPIFDPEAKAPAPEMPEVQEHAVAAARQRLAEEAGQGEASSNTANPPRVNDSPARAGGTPVKGETDDQGRGFDPALHEFPIRLNRGGFIAKKRGGAKKAFESQSRAVDPASIKPQNSAPLASISSDASAGEAPNPAAIEANAVMCTGLFLTTAKMVGGEEFEPEKDEPEMLKNAFVAYFHAKGVVDIPPGAALVITMGMFIGSRWNKPIFKEKRENWWSKAKKWLFSEFT